MDRCLDRGFDLLCVRENWPWKCTSPSRCAQVRVCFYAMMAADEEEATMWDVFARWDVPSSLGRPLPSLRTPGTRRRASKLAREESKARGGATPPPCYNKVTDLGWASPHSTHPYLLLDTIHSPDKQTEKTLLIDWPLCDLVLWLAARFTILRIWGRPRIYTVCALRTTHKTWATYLLS